MFYENQLQTTISVLHENASVLYIIELLFLFWFSEERTVPGIFFVLVK